jgi:MFS family permease
MIKIPGTLCRSKFTLLWAGQTVSRFGDNIFRVAFNIWLVQRTGSAGLLAATMLFSLAPEVLLLLVGGVASDRISKGSIVLACDVARGVAVGILAALAACNRLEIWIVWACNLVFGVSAAFFQPAYRSLIPELVAVEETNQANAMIVIGEQLAAILGPIIGGVCVSIGTSASAFSLDVVSFIVSAACVVPIRKSGRTGLVGKKEGIMVQIRDGIGVVSKHGFLYVTIYLFAMINITAASPVAIALPILAGERDREGSYLLAVLYSMMSLGAILSGVILGRWKRFRHRGFLIYSALICAGASLASLGLRMSLTALMIGALLLGVSGTVCNLAWYNALYELVPAEKLGRVSSVDFFGSTICIPIGYALTSLAVDKVSVEFPFLVGGSITVALAALGLTHSQVRKYD